jgi:Patatin-like phospholipase
MDISINNSRELGTGGSQSEREPARIVRAGGSPGLKLVNLALQGGGAHGAFASGALDRLLEEKRIAFDGISVTSAAAINATVLAAGLAEGGRRIAHLGSLTPLQPSLADRLSGKPLSRRLFLYAIRLGDPTVLAYQFNPVQLQSAAPGADRDRRLRGRCVPVIVWPSCSCRPRMSAPAKSRSSRTTRSDPRRSSRHPVCSSFFKRSRSAASTIGTAVTWAIRRSSR